MTVITEIFTNNGFIEIINLCHTGVHITGFGRIFSTPATLGDFANGYVVDVAYSHISVGYIVVSLNLNGQLKIRNS
jgi:hypothetical protein